MTFYILLIINIVTAVLPTIFDHYIFFINLGGYLENRFEEQHYVLLTIAADRGAAFKAAKETLFFQHNRFDGANSHIDDRYGIDVDDLYEIEDILSPEQKGKYRIELRPENGLAVDEIHLGYLKLSQLTAPAV